MLPGNMSSQSRHETDYGPKHDEACHYFNWLVLDLKLQQMGHAEKMSAPVSPERLAEADKHLQDLQQCQERKLFR